MAQKTLAAPTRTEFGKGAARRTRRAGNIPAVVYGHGADPIHVAIDNLGFLAIVREEGVNAVIALDIDGKETTALVKSIAQNPLTREIEHVDFLTVKKGEKVEVEVPLLVEGEVAPVPPSWWNLTSSKSTLTPSTFGRSRHLRGGPGSR
ncbi:MAG: 50S ribosomal protein L25 [Lawsonella clevelandensis]